MSELGSVFGRNLIHDALGTVRVGDLVEVLSGSAFEGVRNAATR
jgi:hypothetical protein